MKRDIRFKLKLTCRHLLVGLIIVTLLFTAGCVSDQATDAEGVGGDNNIINGKDAEKMTDEMRARPEGVPPIDGQIPEELKTATLAMG